MGGSEMMGELHEFVECWKGCISWVDSHFVTWYEEVFIGVTGVSRCHHHCSSLWLFVGSFEVVDYFYFMA
jgi:hypothetical protein